MNKPFPPLSKEYMRCVGHSQGLVHALAMMKTTVGQLREELRRCPRHHNRRMNEIARRMRPVEDLYERIEKELRELQAFIQFCDDEAKHAA